MLILNWQVHSSSNFASFFILMTQNSSVNFKLIHFLLFYSSKSQFLDFRTCSGENLPNSSCHSWKHKSVFLQMLHQYSVLSKITPLYFFQLKHSIFTLVKSSPLKRKFLNFRVFGSIFVKFFMSILNWQVNSSSIFASFFIVMTHSSPVNFKLIYFQL